MNQRMTEVGRGRGEGDQIPEEREKRDAVSIRYIGSNGLTYFDWR